MYCSIANVQSILPDNIVIGTNLIDQNVSILQSDVQDFIDFAATIINSNLSGIYRTPLLTTKVADLTTDPPTFTEDFPEPIRLMCTRLAAGHLYDELVNANQEPNIVDWGKNQRSLAYDDLTRIISGQIILEGQSFYGNRFRRQELLDEPRLSRPGEIPLPSRQAGT